MGPFGKKQKHNNIFRLFPFLRKKKKERGKNTLFERARK